MDCYWKPADRPVAFVITAQGGFRGSMARSTSSAPPQLYHFVHICTHLYIFVYFGDAAGLYGPIEGGGRGSELNKVN